MSSAKRVLLFGSGLVARSVLTYFAKQPAFAVTMASSDRDSLDRIKSDFPDKIRYVLADINDKKTCSQLVSSSDIVISLLPPPLHPTVAQYCLEEGRDMVTSSYLNPDISALDAKAREKNLTVLFELGLDPG